MEQIKKLFVTILEEELDQLNYEVPNINAGGCGFMAYLLADKADEWGIPYKITLMGYDSDKPMMSDFEANIEMDKGCGYRIPRCHIAIELNGMMYDTEGSYEDHWAWEKKGHISKKTLLRTLEECGWNESFNPKDTFRLEHLVDKLFTSKMSPVYYGMPVAA